MKQYYSVLLVDLEHWGDKLSNDIWYMVETLLHESLLPYDALR